MMRARLSHSRAMAALDDFRLVVGPLTITSMDTQASGPSLRLQRRAAGLTVDAVARAMRADPAQPNRERNTVSAARIRALEAQSHVRSGTVARYLEAITVAHSERAREAVAEAIADATGDLAAEEED